MKNTSLKIFSWIGDQWINQNPWLDVLWSLILGYLIRNMVSNVFSISEFSALFQSMTALSLGILSLTVLSVTIMSSRGSSGKTSDEDLERERTIFIALLRVLAVQLVLVFFTALLYTIEDSFERSLLIVIVVSIFICMALSTYRSVWLLSKLVLTGYSR